MSRKKILLLLAGVLLLALLIAFVFFREIRVSGTAILNGKELSEPITLRYFLFEIHGDAIVPLVKSYECLGYRSTWESDTVCRIEKGEEEYLLDLSARTFISMKGSRIGENILFFGGGENHGVIRVEEKEVYINLGVLRVMQMMLGKTYRCNIDFWHHQLVFDLV